MNSIIVKFFEQFMKCSWIGPFHIPEPFLNCSRTMCIDMLMNSSCTLPWKVHEPFLNCSWTMCIEMFLNFVPWNVHELFMNRTMSCSRTIHELFMNSVRELFMCNSWSFHQGNCINMILLDHRHEHATNYRLSFLNDVMSICHTPKSSPLTHTIRSPLITWLTSMDLPDKCNNRARLYL